MWFMNCDKIKKVANAYDKRNKTNGWVPGNVAMTLEGNH